MFRLLPYAVLLSLFLIAAEREPLADQTSPAVDSNWVSSVLNGEKLSELLKDNFSTGFSGLIFKPDSTLTDNMPIISPPPVDEGIFIPGFKKENNTITLPPETE